MTYFKQNRIENKRYLEWVREQPCAVCGVDGDMVQAHHIIGFTAKGMGMKNSDLFAVPLCGRHHHEIHVYPEMWKDQMRYLCSTLETAYVQGVLKIE